MQGALTGTLDSITKRISNACPSANMRCVLGSPFLVSAVQFESLRKQL
jgi:hypothetical protein